MECAEDSPFKQDIGWMNKANEGKSNKGGSETFWKSCVVHLKLIGDPKGLTLPAPSDKGQRQSLFAQKHGQKTTAPVIGDTGHYAYASRVSFST